MLGVCIQMAEETGIMIEGKRIAILVEEGFEDSQFVETSRAMKEADVKVVVVGSGSQECYRGKRGNATVKVDVVADKVNANDFDAIVVPGGYAPDKMRLHQSMIDLIRDAYDRGKVVAAICHGPQVLISADIVRGRRITSWPSLAVDLKNAGADWVDEPVVRDGNLITSRKPADIPRFTKTIVEALNV